MTAPRRDLPITLCASWIAIATVAFAVTAGALQWIRADLNPVAMPLSAYLRGPGGVWLRGAYDLMASALACLAWAGHRVTRESLRSGLASALFVAAAITLPVVAATVLYENTPSENLARLLHGVAAQTTFLCLVMGMLLLSTRWLRDAHMQRSRYTGVVLAWLAFVQMWVLALWKGLPPGLTQKALIVLILLWLAWAARQLWRASAQPN
ncbi:MULTISPECIES: DUF998 domain-containing protein [unclassified Dyella]|uniref:DUF998 domain-containing protein n=1 Tax=unclassified Dyella TaxID=2634549 RepID=UPI000C83713F|nr:MULTISPECIES: DUF998 domain-containing protein [unclassified Dyella]MDR3447882.1 DUF998 domain-containing protein [Dyella sp.]PMQ03430.1 hypothetical protein DyAD56_19370 [Dyella sp. AD56]